MKKLSAILLAFTLVFSSVGTTLLFANDAQTVEAKSYKSGKKGFNNTNTNTNSNIQKNNDDATSPTTAKQNNNTTTKQDTTKSAKSNKGGLMKGLMLGGLAGLLFGSLFGGMGILGSILGLLVNVLAIGAIVLFLVKIYQLIKRKKEKEVTETWKN